MAVGFTIAKELFPVQIAGTATGLVNLFPFAGGAVLQPLTGYFLERHGRTGDAFTLAGYQDTFLILIIYAVVALGASFFFREAMVRE